MEKEERKKRTVFQMKKDQSKRAEYLQSFEERKKKTEREKINMPEAVLLLESA